MPAVNRVNDVFKIYEHKAAKLTVRMLDKKTILLEGDSVALEFLGDLLHSCARSSDHSAQFSPNGAGSARFTKQSTLGIYAHRLPCPESRSGRKSRLGKKSAATSD